MQNDVCVIPFGFEVDFNSIVLQALVYIKMNLVPNL